MLTLTSRDIELKVHAREGGAFILPNGGTREDLISTARIREYVQKHVLDWYIFVIEQLSTIYPNGTLYVITGTDKAVEWASCMAFPRETQRRRVSNPSTIIYRGATADEQHHWDVDYQTEFEMLYQRARDIDIAETGACALFLRGMRFAVSQRDWSRYILHYKNRNNIPYSVIRTMPNFGLRAKIQTFKECRSSYSQKVPSESGPCVRVCILFYYLDSIIQLIIDFRLFFIPSMFF